MMQSDTPTSPAADPQGLGKSGLAFLALLFALALVLRMGWVLGARHAIEFPDEKQHLSIAENFLRGEGLAITVDSRTSEPLHYPLEIHRPPVYPLVLALLTKCGLGLDGVRVVQALLGALACVMVYLLACELAGEWAGRIAGLLAAADPFAVYFTGLVLSETLFLLLFVTSWYYVVRTWREASGGAGAMRWVASCMVAGLLAAASSLTRSEALPVYFLVPVAWLVVGPARAKGLLASVVMLLVLLVGMSPWVARNYRRTWDKDKGGRFVLTTCNVGESLYEAVGPFATGGPNKGDTAWPPDSELLIHDEYARDRLLFDKSLDYMKNNPRRTLRLAGVKLLRTWNIFPNYGAVRSTRNLWISAGFLVPVYLAALLGLGALCCRRPLAWVLVPVLTWTLLHAVFVGSVRYRLPMMPLVFVLSGAGAAWLASRVRGRRSGDEAGDKEPT